MSKDQIKEMAKVIDAMEGGNAYIECFDNAFADADKIAEILYNAGYRKQIVGGWKFHKDGSGTCSECHVTQRNVWDYDNWQNFCGHCGAKMKGGAE